MPKPPKLPVVAEHCEPGEPFSKVIEEEEQKILQLAQRQHAEIERSIRLSFAKLHQLDVATGLGQHAKHEDETQMEDGEEPPFNDGLSDGPVGHAAFGSHALLHHSNANGDMSPSSAAEHLSRSGSSTLKRSRSKHNVEGLLGLQTGNHTSEYIDFVAGALVLLNSVVMLAELEAEGMALGAQLGMTTGPKLSEVTPIFQALDSAFVFVFLCELVFRIVLERKGFLSDMANWFDAFLVAFGLVDIFVLAQLTGANAQNIVLLRLVRVIKSLRAIRMLRAFRVFKGLRFLVKACYCFLPSLAWSCLLLLVFICMGTLVLGNLLQDFIGDDSANMEDRQWVWDRYGTASRAIYTLYEITFAGNWPTSARPVMERVNRYFVLFFVLYISIVVFAAVRVITAVFLRDTLEAAKNDDESLVVDRLRNKSQYVAKLEDVFEAIDSTHDGMITEEQLAKILAKPQAVAYFQTLDVDVVESHALFSILDNGDGTITHEEFVDGILRCKGPARAMEQVAMRSELRQVDAKLSKLMMALESASLIDHRFVKTPTLQV